MGQLLLNGPATNRGGVYFQAQAAVNLRGGKPVRSGWFCGKQFTQQRLDLPRPVWGMVAAGNSGLPGSLPVMSRSTKVISIEFIEACATQTQSLSGGSGREFTLAESSQHFTD